MTAQQLKNSVLQMAVQGKLVPQEPDDEPAIELLKRIKAKKEKLIKEKKIIKENNPSEIFIGEDNLPYEKNGNKTRCIADEVPFEIPENWCWCRVKEVTILYNGKAFKPSEWKTTGLPIIRIQNLNNPSAPVNYCNSVVDEEYLLHGGELLFAWSGTPGTSFGAHIWKNMKAVLNQHIFKLVFDEESLYKKYYMYALNQRVNELIDLAHGSAGLQHITKGTFENTLIPLPPLAEQQRIVSKIEKLLPYIEKYEQSETQLSRIQANFPVMLKKSILQQAVMGKLVPQDTDDEPASILLERIRAEKAQLVKDKKIKADKHESRIIKRDNYYFEIQDGIERCIDDELPFDVPESWEWVRLGNIGDTNIGLTYKPSDKTDSNGTLVLRSGNIKNGLMNYEDNVFVSCSIPERAMIKKGDILICARNGSRSLVGKCAIVDKEGMAFGAFMAKFSSNYNEYVKIFIDSPIFRQQLDGVKTETINQITQNMLKGQLIPFPPLNEQKRIVAKINDLFKICENMEKL